MHIEIFMPRNILYKHKLNIILSPSIFANLIGHSQIHRYTPTHFAEAFICVFDEHSYRTLVKEIIYENKYK